MTQSMHDIASELTETAHLSESDYHRLLSSKRRRAILDVLDDHATPIRLEELAPAVADREPDIEAADQDVRSVKLTLHHVHLPMMDHLGVIDYDYETQLIE